MHAAILFLDGTKLGLPPGGDASAPQLNVLIIRRSKSTINTQDLGIIITVGTTSPRITQHGWREHLLCCCPHRDGGAIGIVHGRIILLFLQMRGNSSPHPPLASRGVRLTIISRHGCLVKSVSEEVVHSMGGALTSFGHCEGHFKTNRCSSASHGHSMTEKGEKMTLCVLSQYSDGHLNEAAL